MICRAVERRRELLVPCLLAVGFSLALGAAARADEDLSRLKGTGEVVITSGGGTWEDAQRKAYFEPFEKDTGIKVVLVPEDHAKLLASVIDDRDWRLEVSRDGVVDLSDKTANPTGEDYDETLHCYFETWMTGTDFVGPSAAGDKGLVGRLATALRENYPNLKNEKFVYVDLG